MQDQEKKEARCNCGNIECKKFLPQDPEIEKIEPTAIVIDNNQPFTQHIVETKYNTTLDVGAKLFTEEQLSQAKEAGVKEAEETNRTQRDVWRQLGVKEERERIRKIIVKKKPKIRIDGFCITHGRDSMTHSCYDVDNVLDDLLKLI
jgi:hypothetical protein